MYLSASLLSTIFLAGGTLATYGTDSSYGSGSSGSDSTSSPASSPAAFAGTATPSGQVMMHVVKVSNKAGSLTFEPNNLQAAAGSMVQFQFYPKNHSVVQSTFDQPCEPIRNNNASASGFFSGFMPVKPGDAMMPAYTIMINDTRPTWYYCSQAKHCQNGMVGVINPPAAANSKSRTIAAFTSLAKSAPENLSPGQQKSSSSSSSGSSGSSSYYGSGSSSSSSSSPPSTSAVTPVATGSSSSSSGSGSTFTTPLSGTNSSSTGAAAPSGSSAGGGSSVVPFEGGAKGLAVGMGKLGLVGLVVGLVVVGYF